MAFLGLSAAGASTLLCQRIAGGPSARGLALGWAQSTKVAGNRTMVSRFNCMSMIQHRGNHTHTEGPKTESTTAGASNQKKTQQTAPVPAPVPNIEKWDMRVGRIVSIEKHKDADSLYVEQVDVGDAQGPRTIVSGLVKFIPADCLQDQLVVVLCNLKPASMRGIKSHGMLLAASSADRNHVEVLQPPNDALPGMHVTVNGSQRTLEGQLNPKKKDFEATLRLLRTNAQCTATYEGKQLLTEVGPVGVASLADAQIS